MLNIEITETKNFVKKLLMEPVFDTFLLVEAYVRSDVSYTIDGRLNPSFFDTEELEEMTSNTYTTWGAVRHHIFNVIKGNKLPLNFKIVLILSDANINRIIEQNHLNLTTSDIANLSLNIYFDGEKISLTTMAWIKHLQTSGMQMYLLFLNRIRSFNHLLQHSFLNKP